jgi:Arc/MetJ family transcription regulator
MVWILTGTQKDENFTHKRGSKKMRTNIEIDDRLLRRAMRTGKGRTKRSLVETGLRLLVEVHSQGRIRRLRGKVRWNGDLNLLRQGRPAE